MIAALTLAVGGAALAGCGDSDCVKGHAKAAAVAWAAMRKLGVLPREQTTD